MKTIFILAFLTYDSFACRVDSDCSFGNSCVIPKGDHFSKGYCIEKVDTFNQRIHQDHDYVREEVESCTLDSECDFMYKCHKSKDRPNGICVKR